MKPEQLEKCKLVVTQMVPDPNRKINENSFHDPEFWFSKGFSMQQKDGTEAALDYYLQGIRCSSSHFPCVYNLACVYANLEKHQNALKWFNIAIKIDPNSTDAYYGSSLSSFKMKRFKEAFENLKNMPSTAQS